MIAGADAVGAGRRDGLVAWGLLLGFVAWTTVRALTTVGFLEADEVAHFLYARGAPGHPLNFLHVWARPLYTLLLAPLASMGIDAARMLSVASGAVAAACAYLACRALGWRAAAAAVPAAFAQPLFFQQTAGLWTEITFSALLGCWIVALVRNKPRTLAGIAATLPLLRPEGLLVILVTALVPFAGSLRGQREWRPARLGTLFILPCGVLLWAAAGWAASGDPLWLPHHWPPNWAPSVSYGHGPAAWLLDAVPAVVPSALIPLLLLGCVAPGISRFWPMVLVAVVVLAGHAVLWTVGAFGSAGYPRYFVTLAPAFAVLVAGGVEVIGRVLRPVPPVAWACVLAVAAVFLLLRHPTATVRPPLPPDARLFAELGRWVRKQDPTPVLHAAHPFAYLALDAVPAERFDDFGLVRTSTLRAAPPSSWLLVEDRFYLTPRPSADGSAAEGNPGEEELSRLGFEKVAVPDLGVHLAATDPRHDSAIERMHWALYRKGPP